MTNQDKQYKIYIRNTKQWVPVSEEVYLEYYRPIWRLQKEAQKNGQCVCPKSKLWACNGDCATCEYRAAGNTISLDAPMENPTGEEFCLLDWNSPKRSPLMLVFPRVRTRCSTRCPHRSAITVA